MGRFAARLRRGVRAGLARRRATPVATSGLGGWSGSVSPGSAVDALLEPLRGQLASGVPHEDDFRYFTRFEGDDGLFLDVGANVGQSAVSLRAVNRSMPIVSFEPNPLLEPVLARVRSDLLADFAYRMVGLSDAPGSYPLHVPVIDGVHVTPLATLDATLFERPVFDRQLREMSATGSYTVEQVTIRTVRLDDLELQPAVIKLDTEEHELACLRGMEATIARCRPVLMIEDNPQQPVIADWLGERGYVARLYDPAADRLVDFERRPGLVNVFYVPGP